MWFPLSLLALFMLVVRRGTEKHVASNINTMAISWLQQALALPFILFTLFFARFYWPSELSAQFWQVMAVFVVLVSVDIFCYFRALSIADISYIAPLMTLVAVGNILGAYFILGQKPTMYGLVGAGLIVFGAGLVYRAKHKDHTNFHANKSALIMVLLIVVARAVHSNIEVFMLREANPTSFNFYSSVLTVPFILLITILITKTNRNDKYKDYWKSVKKGAHKHIWLLLFIGATYTINMLATYQAKLIGPNAGYVGSVKAASVLPIVLVGVFFFEEKVVRIQWLGLGFIVLGLIALALN